MKECNKNDKEDRRGTPELISSILFKVLDTITWISLVGVYIYCYVICTIYMV